VKQTNRWRQLLRRTLTRPLIHSTGAGFATRSLLETGEHVSSIESAAAGGLHYAQLMATQEQDAHICGECGGRLAPDLRYCVHCYSPVGAGAARAHVELARKTATTHRPDPTLVFSPEKHEAIARRARGRKRMIITAVIALAIVIAGSIGLNIVSRNRREGQRTMARSQAAERDLNTLADALERFKEDVQRYPTNEEGLICLTRKPAALGQDVGENQSSWLGPYLEHVPEVDPWGNDYVYRTLDGGRNFELFSHGPGGETGSDSRFRVGSQASTEP
jgi:general secretion pathway protein G